jgi:O-antigen ligase
MLGKFLIQSNINYAFFIFYLGVFLLPSAFSIAAFLLIIASIIGFKKNNKIYIKDKINVAFLISSAFMIISCVFQTINYKFSALTTWTPSLSWIGLVNWIPFFFLSWGFEPYLITAKSRKRFALALLAGSFPVLITGIGQVFFNWHGPKEILNGLIIWYSRPSENNVLTGLFNNPNYAGAWLNIILPIALAKLVKKDSFLQRAISLIFLSLIIICIILTNSRSAWIGLFASIILFFGVNSLKWVLTSIIVIAIPIIYSLLNQQFTLIPTEALNEFSNFQYLDRLDMWIKSFQIISENPLFGSGAASFSEIYQNISGIEKNHSHNLILEMIISYGIPAALFTFIPITYLTLDAIQKCFLREIFPDCLIERSLVTSLIIILMMHMVDIQYFDGRISLIIWILIAAIKNISHKKSNKSFQIDS